MYAPEPLTHFRRELFSLRLPLHHLSPFGGAGAGAGLGEGAGLGVKDKGGRLKEFERLREDTRKAMESGENACAC